MKILQSLSSNWDEFRYKQGHMSEAEHFLNELPELYQPVALDYMRKLSDSRVSANPNLFYSTTLDFCKFLEDVHPGVKKSLQESQKSMFTTGKDSFYSYRPAGTKLWNYFPNPFAMFSYIEDNLPVAAICTGLIRTAIEEDGFFLVAAKGVKEAKLLKAYDMLRDLRIEELRVELAAHLSVFGNAWIRPERSKLGVKDIELMYPSRLMPLLNKTTGRIAGYKYTQGRQEYTYDRNDLLHLKFPAIDNGELGCPPWMAGVTRIETSLNSINLNNTMMYTGGMMSHIVSLKVDGPSLNGVPADKFLEMVQKQFDYLYSGAKFGHRVVVGSNIDNVFPIAKMGELDTNWKYGDARTDKLVAMLSGIPSEKVGVPRSESAQYQPELVENVINAQFDSTINRFTRKIDRFLNRYVLREMLGIDDMKIVPAGRYGALTLNAAQTLDLLAKVGNMITVNEGRERIMGWEPLHPDDPRGNIILNNSAVRAIKEGNALIPDVFAPEQVDPELESERTFLTALDKISRENLKLCVGGRNDGELFKENKKVRRQKSK